MIHSAIGIDNIIFGAHWTRLTTAVGPSDIFLIVRRITRNTFHAHQNSVVDKIIISPETRTR